MSAMNNLPIEDRIKKILAREVMVRLKPEEIDSTASLIDDIGLDSIQVLELIVALEDEFGITLEDEDLSLELFKNVNSVAAYVGQKLAGKMVKPFRPDEKEN